MTSGKISNENQITTFLHCGLCSEEYFKSDKLKSTISPKEYQDIDVGYTKIGIQIWCNRHDCNILHMDFEGQKHYANTSRKPEKKELNN